MQINNKTQFHFSPPFPFIAPKRPQSAYFLYLASVRDETKAQIEKTLESQQAVDEKENADKKPNMIALIGRIK